MIMPDSSTPRGTWYLKKWYANADHDNNIFTDPLTISDDRISLNLLNFTVFINHDPINNTYTGSIGLEQPNPRFSYTIDQIRWNNNNGERNLEFVVSTFRGRENVAYERYSGKIVEGIFVGRFTHFILDHEDADSSYRNHVTGWNSEYIDQNDIVPRVYDIVLYNADY